MKLLKGVKPQQGQGLVEYALLLVLVAVVVLGILLLLGPQINAVFSRVIVALQGQDPANPGYTYQIQSFSVNGSAGAGGCTVRLANAMRVKVSQNGTVVPSASVSVAVSLQTGGSTTLTATSDSSGIATWPASTSIGTDPNGCGRTATATVSGASATDTY